MKYIDEVLSKEKKLSKEEYEKELIKRIDELEHDYIRILKLDFKAQELFNKKILKRNTKEVKQKLRVLQKELDDKYNYEGSIYDNISYSIIRLDYLFKTHAYDDFCKIKIEKNPKKKLKLYIKVYVSLIENYNKLDYGDFKNKRVTKNIIELIKNKISKEKSIIRNSLQEENVEKKEELVITPKKKVEEQKDYLDITSMFNIKFGNIEEVMLSYKNMVRTAPININLINYASIIRSRLINEDKMAENYELINGIIDQLKYRKLELKKPDKKEKRIIRLCIDELKELSEQVFLRNMPLVEVHDYKFEIIFELLRDKKNYQLIRKIVSDYPAVVNTRNNKRSILSYILQLYINNYMMILNDHIYNYNIDYLKEVYKLFASSNSLYLSDEDKIELDSILDNFVCKISELDINSKKKNYAINEAKELYLESINNDNNYHKRIDKYLFDANIKDLEFLDPNHSKRPTEIDLTDEHTFILENPYICYSFIEAKGVKSLKFHTADFSNLVPECSALEKYTYNCLIDNKKINSTLSEYLEFKKDDIVSAFTYEIIMDNDRNIKDFKVYKSRIRVDGEIMDYSNNKYVYDNLRRIVNDYIQDFGDVKLTGLSKIEYILNDILNKQYLKLTRNNNLPIIVSKEKKVPAIDSETFSKIQNVFNKLTKKDYRRLSKIFEEKVEEKYYDNKTRYDEKNVLNISGNPNYLYLMNQRMMKVLLMNDYPISQEKYSQIKQKTIEDYEELIKALNETLDYKTEEDFDYKKRRNFKTYVKKLK